MKRGASVVLIGLGVFLLVLAPTVKFWAAPRLVKAPTDINAVLHAGGDNFNYLNGQTGQNEKITVSVTRHIIGDVSSSNSDVAVYQESLCLTRDDNKQGLGCVRADDPRLITNTSDRVAFDRVSGEAVTGNVCGSGGTKNCNASVNGDPNVKHVGLDYKFPIDTKKQTYSFFDTVVGKPFPAVYKGTEKKGGLDCYKFVQTIPESPVLPTACCRRRTATPARCGSSPPRA